MSYEPAKGKSKPKFKQTANNKINHKNKPEHKGTASGKGSNKTQSYDRKVKEADEVKIGDRIVVTIKRIGINGEGVGYYKRKAVFIDGAITDEVVKAKVTRVERSYLQAEVVELEKKSSSRQKPPCDVYEQCGGCQLQHMTYAAQLKAKEEIVREAFSRYTKIEQIKLLPAIGMDHPWHYRNKAQLQVGKSHKNKFITGLYAAGSHKLIDISGCLVQDKAINEVYEKLKPVIEELNIEPYDEKGRQGVLKSIVVRIAQKTGKLQLTFVTATDKLPHQEELVASINKLFPNIISISQNIHKEKSPLIFGPTTITLWGEEQIEEKLGDLQFSLSARAFFQLNPEQTVKLYDAAKNAARLTGTELVIDAYCGTGTIGLWLAKQAKEVRGIEVIADAVQDAKRNAEASGISNAYFYEGKAEELLPKWLKQGMKPDVVVVDPPRTGLDASLIQAIKQAQPKRIVYVSCNPSTLAKDCQLLLEEGKYRLGDVQPIDMFPQTSNVEVVTWLEKVNK